MEMESHEKLKCIFFWLKKATKGSSFYALKKSILARVLEMYSWIKLLIIKTNRLCLEKQN
jgi:hypothetical protein